MSQSLPRLLLLTTSTLVACEPVLYRDVGEQGLLRGYVYDDYTYIGEYAVLDTAELSVRDKAGEPTGEIAAPTADTPGYWQVQVEPGQVVEFVVSAPDRLTTVRVTTGPTTLADFTPYVFPRAAEVIVPLFDELAAGLGTEDSTAFLAGEVGAFWMEPLNPSDWEGADISLMSNDGIAVPFIALADLGDGVITESNGLQVDQLVAPAIPAGRVILTVTTATGATVSQSWTVRAGELIDATWFHLPQ